MDISVAELKEELFGDSDITEEDLEMAEEAESPGLEVQTARASVSDEDREKFGEYLFSYEDYSEEEIGFLFAHDKPQWPVSNVMYAAAGPLAATMRDFLDDMEPLIGLIADEMEHSDDPILDARKVVMATGYLNLNAYIFAIFQYLNSGARRSSESEWFFNNNYTFDEQLRNAWLDEYPFSLWDVIGWHSNLNPFDAFNSLNGWEMRNRFRTTFLPINSKYPTVPDKELYESACNKLVRGLAQLMNLDYSKLQEVCQVEDLLPAIDDWHAFLEQTQGFVPRSTIEYFKNALTEVDETGADSRRSIDLRLQVLKSFALTFQAPYLNRDMDLWRQVAKETYERARRHPDFAKAIDSLYEDPFETEYGTALPKGSVFVELVEAINWAHDFGLSFDDADATKKFFYALMNFQMQVIARHHYPTRKQARELTELWESFTDAINGVILRELKTNDSIESGSFLEKIETLVGLAGIKNRLRELAALVQANEERNNLPPLQHMVFSGNPGTGKTSVAVILGEIFATLGLLKSGHVVSVTRADLVAQYTGQTAPKVQAAVERAMGGILFIDEAYTLKRDALNSEQDSFGQEAIDALLTRMENDRGKFIVIAAGYPAEMQRFIDSNPGLRSRFSDQWNFDDYSAPELFEMFQKLASDKQIELTDEVEPEFIRLASNERQKANFANARWQRTLLENAQRRMAARLAKESSESGALIPEDLSEPPKNVEISQNAIDQIRERLSTLVGLSSVKEDVETLIAFQLVQQRRQAQGLPLLGSGIGHLVFAGPPGTGKTTVARLIGQFYKELGLLESGHCVETQRADLVAGFIGQTAIRTREVINKAMGGILFIDEAYTLIKSHGPGSAEDFGQEAVDTLLKMMEDNKGSFAVVIAGYPDKMQEFLNSNPGMRSRFDKTLLFEPWNATELATELSRLLSDSGFSLDESAQAVLVQNCQAISARPAFASGRTARSFREKIIEAQARRIGSDTSASLTEIVAQDIDSAAAKLQ